MLGRRRPHEEERQAARYAIDCDAARNRFNAAPNRPLSTPLPPKAACAPGWNRSPFRSSGSRTATTPSWQNTSLQMRRGYRGDGPAIMNAWR